MQKAYSSDLTDAQWKVIKPVFADQRQYAEHSPRKIMNALFYLLKSGCQWRMLPNDFAPWKTVYDHFQKWIESGRIERLCTRLRRAVRLVAGRHPSPSAAVIDAQSVPSARQGGPERGRDGGKNVKGRKRHVVVRAMGLVLAVLVGAANKREGQKAPHVFQKLLGKVPRLEVVFADKGYKGTPGGLVKRCFGWLLNIVLLNIVQREEESDSKGFEPIPKRWVVERTFGWFASWRRLSRDYEHNPESSEAMIQIGMSRLMISRLA